MDYSKEDEILTNHRCISSSLCHYMEKTGGTATLMRDLEKAREKFSVGDFFQIGEPITTEKGITEFITLSPFFDSMSSITMLDPSNGTFTGFYDAKPMMTDITADPEDSNHHYWYESFWIHTYPWHIGIKSDADTKGPNLDIGTIERTYLNDWVLGDDSSLNDSPIASWWCSIFDTSCEDHDNFHFQDKENQRDCKWLFNLEKGSEEWAKHCDRRVKGQTIHNRCPRACGMCDAEDHGVTPW